LKLAIHTSVHDKTIQRIIFIKRKRSLLCTYLPLLAFTGSLLSAIRPADCKKVKKVLRK